MPKPKAKAVTVSFSCEFPNYKDMSGFDLSTITEEQFYDAVKQFKSFAEIGSESKFRYSMTYFWSPQKRVFKEGEQYQQVPSLSYPFEIKSS